jgi:hypothetical protein
MKTPMDEFEKLFFDLTRQPLGLADPSRPAARVQRLPGTLT